MASRGESRPLLGVRHGSGPINGLSDGTLSDNDGEAEALVAIVDVPTSPPARTPKRKGARSLAHQASNVHMAKSNVPAMKEAAMRRRPKRQAVGLGFETVSDSEAVDAYSRKRRVSAFCIAKQLPLTELTASIRPHCRTCRNLNDEVLYFTMPKWGLDIDAFLFASYGAIVVWGLGTSDEKRTVEWIMSFLPAQDVNDSIEADDFIWCTYLDEEASLRFQIDKSTFVLPRTDVTRDVMNKLASSYAMATSIKLDVLEVAIEKTIQNTAHIPEDLAELGKINLSKTEVSKYIGELYIIKAQVNLMYDILDAPDYFWDTTDDSQRIYAKTRRFLDIDQRVEVLNKRMDVVAELLDILRTEKSEQHSSRLEWIVIWLIVVEILLGLSDIAFNHLGNKISLL